MARICKFCLDPVSENDWCDKCHHYLRSLHEMDTGGFVFNESYIKDPTLDETGRFEVDPVDHYGEVKAAANRGAEMVAAYLLWASKYIKE